MHARGRIVVGEGGTVLPVSLVELLDALDLQVSATRRGCTALGGDGISALLFPGCQPLPARRMPARQLGIHITVAVPWQRSSAADWAAVASEVSRRPDRPHQPA